MTLTRQWLLELSLTFLVIAFVTWFTETLRDVCNNYGPSTTWSSTYSAIFPKRVLIDLGQGSYGTYIQDLGESVWGILRPHHAPRGAQGGELAGQKGPKGFCEQELESSRPERRK